MPRLAFMARLAFTARLVTGALTALLVAGIAATAQAQPPNPAETQPPNPGQARAKELRDGIKSFRLGLFYNGSERKPFYRLTLKVTAAEQATPFYPIVSITEEQAGKIIDHLDGAGLLAKAVDLRDNTKLPQPTMPGYALEVGKFYEDLGWGLPMLRRLDDLRKVLDGDAAKGMDLLLARLSGLRAQWEKEATSKSIDPARFDQAAVVMRVRPLADVQAKGNRYRWQEVQVVLVLKGDPGDLGTKDGKLHVVVLKDQPGLPQQECTIYLEQYDLGKSAPVKAWMLLAGGSKEGMSHVAASERPGGPANEDVAQLIRQLGDESFAVRQAATKKLTEMGEAAHPVLKDTLEAGGVEVETRRRIEMILAAKPTPPAQGGQSVTDAKTGITVAITGDGNELTASKGGKVFWKTQWAGPAATAVRIEDGAIIVSPGNSAYDPATGKLLWKKQ